MIRMRAKYVNIQVATARGVAERYRQQYPAGDTRRPLGRDTDEVYQQLLALGDNAPIDKVAEIIGNQSWSYISCDGCRDYVDRAVAIGEYETKAYCAICITEAFTALSEPPPMTAERAEELTKRAI